MKYKYKELLRDENNKSKVSRALSRSTNEDPKKQKILKNCKIRSLINETVRIQKPINGEVRMTISRN